MSMMGWLFLTLIFGCAGALVVTACRREIPSINGKPTATMVPASYYWATLGLALGATLLFLSLALKTEYREMAKQDLPLHYASPFPFYVILMLLAPVVLSISWFYGSYRQYYYRPLWHLLVVGIIAVIAMFGVYCMAVQCVAALE